MPFTHGFKDLSSHLEDVKKQFPVKSYMLNNQLFCFLSFVG